MLAITAGVRTSGELGVDLVAGVGPGAGAGAGEVALGVGQDRLESPLGVRGWYLDDARTPPR
jgi:hypothetical protein